MNWLLLLIFCVVGNTGFASSSSSVLTLDGSPYSQESLNCSSYSYFEVNFPYPCRDLNISLTDVIGDLEIYVSQTILFPKKTDLTWGAVSQSSLVISRWDPESSPGVYYIGVYDNCKTNKIEGKFKILVTSGNDTVDDGTDIYTHPSLTQNKLIAANAYKYYHFCVPQCADITVTLYNCDNYTICPNSYSYPEMLLTRTERSPNVNDYTYKLASSFRRDIFVNHTDPAALDRSGYFTGSYYVGIFGWCTPDDEVIYWETDGPCSLAANTTFNITVQMTFYPVEECSVKNLVYPQAPVATAIPLNTVINGTVPCNANYNYYTVEVTEPCVSLNIWIGNNTINSSAPQLAVGKYPNVYPTFNNIAWTSYNYYYQNLTLNLYDPNFDTGYICGSYYNETCVYYIGVYGYCDEYPNPVNYSMIVTTIPGNKDENILNQPLANQYLQSIDTSEESTVSQRYSHYQFCANNQFTIDAEFYLWDNGCNCQNEYSNLQLVLSRTVRDATIGDLTWSIDQDEEYHTLQLNSHNSTHFRQGTFYVNVWSACTPNNECTDLCTCSPCSNLVNTRYGLYVTNHSDFNYTMNKAKYLEVCNDDPGTCSSICTNEDESSTSNNNNDNNKLSTADQIGIAFGVFFFLVIVFAILFAAGWCTYRRYNLLNGSSLMVRSNSVDSSTMLNMEGQTSSEEVGREKNAKSKEKAVVHHDDVIFNL